MKKAHVLMVLAAFVVVASCGDNQDILSQLRQDIRANDYRYTVGDNPATLIPLDKLCGLKEPDGWRDGARFVDTTPEGGLAALPASYDARNDGLVSPVKNQGACGSCWAFSSIATLESIIKKGDGVMTDQSEQYMVSCNTQGWGCNGGWWAFDELRRLKSVFESCYPYTASDSPCQCDCNTKAMVRAWAFVGGTSKVPSVDALQNAIYTRGPLSAGVYVDSSFQHYTGGIYQGPSGQANHAIQLIGWNNNGGYWILKNSWGTGWGENGFMRIKYGSNKVGYAAAFIWDGFYETGDWPPDQNCVPGE